MFIILDRKIINRKGKSSTLSEKRGNIKIILIKSRIRKKYYFYIYNYFPQRTVEELFKKIVIG